MSSKLTDNRYTRFIKDFSNQQKYIKWLMHYTKPYIPKLTFMMLLSIFGTFASIWTTIITQKIIDGASGGKTLVDYIILYVVVVVASEVVSVLSSLMGVMVNEKFSFGIRKQVYDKILDTKWAEISKYHTGDLMTRLTSDTNSIADGIANTIPTIIILIVQLFATFFTLLSYNAALAFFALIFAPFAVLASAFLGRKLKYLTVKVQESESRYRSFINESLSNILIIKTFCDEKYSSKRLKQLREERFGWVLKKTKVGLVASTTMSMTFQIGYLVAFVWGIYCISKGEITYGTMTVFLTLVNRVQAPIISLANYVPKVIAILASAGRVMEIQNLEAEERTYTEIIPENVGLRITDLSFGYTNEMVIDEADLSINPGEFVAIVGESGIGKTTLVRLIMSFVTKVSGDIEFYDNYRSESANAGSREFISYVPQGNTLFSGTIASCVRMGNRDASDEEVIDALKAACAYDFIKELPDGIETVIGERGHGLSEGQAQRVSIARALVRKAPFLILDEATSSLDEKTELKVLQSIREYKPSPTCLLITHRRSVLNYCDREIKLENKKILEEELNI